ncbi:MAG: flagellar basal body rod protein FlgB [Deltaproteobacteria bacterium]|nr:flagellar basal body rod protein FlgB [Deltaproteobacteria bacterium]MBW1928470.1 flagellar basal body rod protein FlgB [Deltaproteobacteria bacterium]MBW2024195.1 flagellar basal body rod protein FlgB [Deltaproteobacteria bacterium]MBW2124898.1 flagellar basal body rod protein FlgB [Deltaproteobacteria bacterium]RLB18061.1 MAG: flagellar basal body rod protein FlgB [Deltaproteobacteria bacterium]
MMLKLGNMIGQTLMDKTAKLLAHALDYRSKRHGVIAGNLANIDTPGYKAKDLGFDETLKAALDNSKLKLKVTQPEHFPALTGVSLLGGAEFPVEEIGQDISGDSQLDLDREMARMAKNNLLYEATVRLLSKKFEELKTVIEEGRR